MNMISYIFVTENWVESFVWHCRIKQQNFLQILKSQIIPESDGWKPRVMFQHDGALSHLGSGLRVRKALDDEFPNRLIGRDGPWQPWLKGIGLAIFRFVSFSIFLCKNE